MQLRPRKPTWYGRGGARHTRGRIYTAGHFRSNPHKTPTSTVEKATHLSETQLLPPSDQQEYPLHSKGYAERRTKPDQKLHAASRIDVPKMSPSQNQPSTPHKIIIGIDYGTTFSGKLSVAFFTLNNIYKFTRRRELCHNRQERYR